MVLLMDDDQVGNIAGVTAMGNEGMQWVGMEPFVERNHFIQNIGDGTYFSFRATSYRACCCRK